MTTCVGDPLYRPFAADHDLLRKRVSDEWTVYADGAKKWLGKPADNGATLAASAEKMHSGIIFEGLGLLQITAGQPPRAIDSFGKAIRNYSDPEDKIRAAIHEIIQLRGTGKVPDALALTRKMLGQFPNAPAAGVLRVFEAQMAPAKR